MIDNGLIREVGIGTGNVMETQRNSNVLVAGANGRLGPLLRTVWRQVRSTAFQPIYVARSGPADIVWQPGDAIPQMPPCTTLIALWGVTSGPPQALAGNVELARAARDLARVCGARTLLHMSSAAVYGPGVDLPETSPPAPVTAYGHAKLDMERVVAGFPHDGIAHCCLRLANVVGADSLAPALRGPQGAPVRLDRFDEGHGPRRSYISHGDLARVLVALANLPAASLPAVVNVAAPAPVGMEDLAHAAGRHITWRPAPDGALKEVSISVARLETLLPGFRWHETAADMIADWQEPEITVS